MALGQFLSQRFGYGVHALAYIAKKPAGKLSTLPEIAAWMRTVWPEASETYLSNVVQRLARGGLLRSHRGVTGGYSLARPAEQINLRDVVELLEGVELDRCSLSLEGACHTTGRCTIQNKLRALEESYLRSMEALTIAELSMDIITETDGEQQKPCGHVRLELGCDGERAVESTATSAEQPAAARPATD